VDTSTLSAHESELAPRAVRLLRKAAYPMHSNAILHEVQQLYGVSDRLDSLAGLHPLVSEALIGISGSVRNTATLLEVLIATKITPLFGSDPASA
jgi:hypothetical protein